MPQLGQKRDGREPRSTACLCFLFKFNLNSKHTFKFRVVLAVSSAA